MEVSALVVSEAADGAPGWYDLAPDFAGIARKQTVAGPELVDLEARPRGPGVGIHLHWWLPDAFGHVDAGEEAPPMPDRWLVQRLRHREGDVPAEIRAVDAWLVESDYVWPDEASAGQAVAFFDATRPGLVARRGRVTPLGGLQAAPAGAAASEHRPTALGPGTPEFAAHYPACRSLLGFHDTFPGNNEGGDWRLTYLVTGWFSRPEDDPLQGAGEGASLVARLEALQWAAATDVVHRRVLCHGAAIGVHWNAAAAPVPGMGGGKIDLAIADTAVDGLAALLAKRGADVAAPWLASLQYGLLDGHADADDAAAVLQRHRFERLPGEDRYTIAKVDVPSARENMLASNDLAALSGVAGGTGTAEPLTRELERALHGLNALARREARRQRLVAKRKQDLYATWARWADDQLKQRTPAGTSLESDGVLRARDGVVAAQAGLAAVHQRRVECETRLRATLEQRYPGRALETSTTAPFYRRATPVLVAAGADLGARNCHVPAHERTPLRCRTPHLVLTHYTAERPAPAQELARDHWPPPRLHQDLLIEARHCGTNEELPKERAPDERALTHWAANPWRPLFLLWSVRWPGAPGDAWRGVALLSPHPDALLRQRLASDDKKLESVRAEAGKLGVVAQSLSGFHEALHGLQQGLQLPPLDPAVARTGAARDRAPFDAVFGPNLELLDHAHMHSPWSKAPAEGAQGGTLEFLSLRVIDAFGQSRDLLAGRNAADGYIVPWGWQPPEAATVHLPPRWVQPARLDFRWRSNERGHPGGSPICGWIFANYLDGSLMVCDAAGKLQGALQRLDAGGDRRPGFAWVDVPGHERRATDIADAELRAFIDWARGLDEVEANGFMHHEVGQACAESVAHPAHDARLSVLLGRPLALARAALSLQFDTPGRHTDATCAVRLGGPTGYAGGIAVWRFAGTGAFFPCPAHEAIMQSGAEGTLEVGASQPLELTLLFDPAAPVHAHCDRLPRHSLRLPPEASAALSNIHEVFFQVAPVLGPPGTAGLPRPSDDYGRWSWAVRPDVTGWTEYPDFTDAAVIGGPASELHDGWLKLDMHPVDIAAFWVKRGSVRGVEPGTRITLGWRVSGARTLELAIEGRAAPLARWDADAGHVLPEEFAFDVTETRVVRLTAADGRGHGSTRALRIIVLSGSKP